MWKHFPCYWPIVRTPCHVMMVMIIIISLYPSPFIIIIIIIITIIIIIIFFLPLCHLSITFFSIFVFIFASSSITTPRQNQQNVWMIQTSVGMRLHNIWHFTLVKLLMVIYTFGRIVVYVRLISLCWYLHWDRWSTLKNIQMFCQWPAWN